MTINVKMKTSMFLFLYYTKTETSKFSFSMFTLQLIFFYFRKFMDSYVIMCNNDIKLRPSLINILFAVTRPKPFLGLGRSVGNFFFLDKTEK